MSEFIIIIAILAALVGPILFWGFVFLAVKRYLSAYQMAAAEEQRLVNQAIHTTGNVSPDLQAQFFAAATQAQQSMSHLNGIHRQRAELRQSELMGMAAQAGIDPPNFY